MINGTLAFMIEFRVYTRRWRFSQNCVCRFS